MVVLTLLQTRQVQDNQARLPVSGGLGLLARCGFRNINAAAFIQ